MELKFEKMHGNGNDMIMIDNRDGSIRLTREQIKRLCNRQFGIGADGVILVEKGSDGADCFMNYYNSDGSEAEMCGNGIRCTADYYQRIAKIEKEELLVGTRAGVKRILRTQDGQYQVDMGSPSFESADFMTERIIIDGFEYRCVSMGNPHAVNFCSNVDAIDLDSRGPAVETNKAFPNKTNVEFVEQMGPDKLKVRVWERGCGATLACGTGACAVYAIAKRLGKISGRVEIQLPGGNLFIEESEQGALLMTGPAKTSFVGSINIQ